jgi:hypothetical protein
MSFTYSFLSAFTFSQYPEDHRSLNFTLQKENSYIFISLPPCGGSKIIVQLLFYAIEDFLNLLHIALHLVFVSTISSSEHEVDHFLVISILHY